MGGEGSRVDYSEFDYLVAVNIAVNNFLPYLELSTYEEEDKIYITEAGPNNIEKEIVLKQEIERLSPEAREIFNLLYFGTEEELIPFMNRKYSNGNGGISKSKILHHFQKKFGYRKMRKVCFQLKKLSELF